MTSLPSCPDCRTSYEPEDNYCRKCGMFLGALRAVAMQPSQPLQPRDEAARSLVQVRQGMPVPVRKAATALAIGTALQIGVGLASKYLTSQAGKQAALAVATPKAVRTKTAPKPAVVEPVPELTAVSETLTIHRVWMRRRQ